MRLRITLRFPLWAGLAALLFLSSAVASGGSPAPVLTQHNDPGRTGANLTETDLNTSNVNVNQFGKLFARPVDGYIFAQPLYVPGLTIGGIAHNVVFVATMHDTVYAFDADNPAASTPLWQVSLGTSAPITYTIPNTTTVGQDFGPPGYTDIAVEIGVLSTPVIDLSTNTLYAVAFTKEPNPATCPCHYAYRLHALDLATGAEKFSGPVQIAGSVPGTGYDSLHGTITFSSTAQLQRASLLLNNSVVYFAFGGIADWGIFHGWVFGYDAATLQQVSIYNSSPSSGQSGIWQSGQGPAADANGHVYVMTGNGLYSGTVTGDYGDSFIQLNPTAVVTGLLPVSDSFTPFDQASMALVDEDLGSGGPLMIPNTNLLLGGGKSGKLYLLNQLDMGGYQQGPGGTDRVVQSFQATNTFSNTGHIHGTPVFWNSPSGPRFYVWGEGEALKEYAMTINSPVSATIQTTPVATGTTTLTANFMPGGFLSVSANGSTSGSGIVWASHPVTDAEHSVTQGVLRAYNAQNVSQELWDSLQNPARDAVGNFAKFNPPTVANGKVYLGTFSGQLLVYGLLGAPWIVTQPVSQTIVSGQSATLAVAASGQTPLNYQWYQGLSGNTSNPIAGATTATFTAAPTQTTNYWVTITNTVQAINSTTAAIVVNPGPIITAQPVSQTINPGRSVFLSVTAFGAAPLSYVWYQGLSGDTSHPIAGTVGASFTTPALTTTTNYWVQVRNSVGTTISSGTAVIRVVPPLPSPWVDADLGFVGFPGSATQVGGVYTVTASGGDIWQTADSFNFAYRPLFGDGSIVARVDSLGNTDPWAKAGVMIRESLDPGATNAMIAVTPGNGITFQRRLTTAGSSINTLGSLVSAPYWVRLVRSGSIFSGYQSGDGLTWTLVASDTIPMTSAVYVGLAVTAHNNGLITSAVFDQVTTQGTGAPPAITAQPQSQTIAAGQSVTLTVGATGSLPLSYQWYQGQSGDTSSPVGTNAASFATPSLATTTRYWVRVSNLLGSAASDAATITVAHRVYLPVVMR